jgi:undecaprenyl-phosphate galactose phosphotransferase
MFQKKIIIVGAGSTGIGLSNALVKERYLGYRIIGFIDDNPTKKGKLINGYPILGNQDSILEMSLQHQVHKVFIAIPSLSSEKLMKLYATLHVYFKEVVIIPQIKGMALTNAEVQHLFNYDLPLLNVRNNLNYTLNIVLKDIFDYLLVVLTLPFFMIILAFISIAIKIESKGPVFFKHTRYAINGKEIQVFKFRSMYHDAEARLEHLLRENEQLRAEWGSNFKLKNDPRVTKVGRFLRKVSLDELPQIINVMNGQMSFIGPRPVIKRELEEYYCKYGEYFCKVKPGITGLWQVSGRSDTNYDFRVRTDIWYVLNWSFWVDIVILIKTVGAVIRGIGAY